eukprot:290837-Rhodomonas_salina.2
MLEDDLTIEFAEGLFTGLFTGLLLYAVFPFVYGQVLTALTFLVTGANLHVSWHHRFAFVAVLIVSVLHLTAPTP